MPRLITASTFLLAATLMAPVVSAAETNKAPAEFSSQRNVACEQQRKLCLDGAVRTGTYGERYVPPDDVARCYAEYRACIGR